MTSIEMVAEAENRSRREAAIAFHKASQIDKLLEEYGQRISSNPKMRHLPLTSSELEKLLPPLEELIPPSDFDKDSVFRSFSWWNGDHDEKREGFTVDICKYVEYFVVETTPKGDIQIYTSLEGCIFVPELRWKTDIKRESLRLALELALKNPLAVDQRKIVYIGPQKLEHREAA